MPITDKQIEAFRVKLENVNREYYEREFPTMANYFGGVETLKGKKNVKYAITTGGQRYVLCFVEIETGTILKAAGWSAPAKGGRGNIATTIPGDGTRWLYRN